MWPVGDVLPYSRASSDYFFLNESVRRDAGYIKNEIKPRMSGKTEENMKQITTTC